MAFLSKVALSLEPKKLPNRFVGAWETVGVSKKAPRTNTVEELTNSIKAYAKDNPEIEEFAKNLEKMDVKHLGLAQDIIDLANIKEMLPTNINLKKEIAPNKTILGNILNRLPDISHKNPEVLNLTEEVISNTDKQNSKYFLCNLFSFDLEKMGNSLAKQMNIVKEMVSSIAKSTLDGSYKMDYEANNNFFQTIKRLCSADINPENLKILNKVIKITDGSKNIEHVIDVEKINKGNTSTMAKNLEFLPQVLKNADAQNKTFDVAGFLTKNVNLD